jgi:hypothetical protein
MGEIKMKILVKNEIKCGKLHCDNCEHNQIDCLHPDFKTEKLKYDDKKDSPFRHKECLKAGEDYKTSLLYKIGVIREVDFLLQKQIMIIQKNKIKK